MNDFKVEGINGEAQEFIQIPDRDLQPQEVLAILERCKGPLMKGMVASLWKDLHYIAEGGKRMQYPVVDNRKVWPLEPAITKEGFKTPPDTVRVSLYLPTGSEKKLALEPRIDFNFRMRPEPLKDLSTPTDRFLCESITLNKKLDSRNEITVRLEQDALNPETPDIAVPGKELKHGLSAFIEYPQIDNNETDALLKNLADEYGLDKEKAEILAKAIAAFKLERSEDQYRNSKIGECMTVPGNFERFCKKEFGLKLVNARYGKQDEYGQFGFYHEVTLISKEDIPRVGLSRENRELQDGIVIDWTAPQYRSPRGYTKETIPYPLMYSLKENREIGYSPLYLGAHLG